MLHPPYSNFESTSDALLRLVDVATMRQNSYGHLSARPAFLSTTQIPYDGLLESPEKFAYFLSGGGGEVTKFVCGYMACEPRLSQVFLSGLPPVFKVSIRNDASGRWLENSIRFSVDQTDASRAGREAVLAKLSEVLFVETLRLYIAHLPSEQTGWLAGARDSEVGKTLALMHRNPAHPWTIATLAQEAGVSRSVLAERFRHYLNEPPMAYLTRWRLQLGAEMLGSTSYSVAQIAAEVGYESEAAFNRAFKREFTVPPARFRSQSRSAHATSSKYAQTQRDHGSGSHKKGGVPC